MAEEYALNSEQFHRRMNRLLSHWKDNPDDYGGAECIVLPVGKPSEEQIYQKGLSLQNHLMSYEFPDTYIMITKDKMFCVCSKKKRDIIEQANSYSGSAKTVDIVGFTISNKDKELVEKSFGEFLAEVKNYAKVGLISKDNYSGDLYENTWKPKFEALGLEQVDVTAGISHLLAVKDPEEMKLMKTAANASSAIMSKYVINEIARIIDDEERIKHEDLSTKIEKVLENQKILGKCGLLNSGIELGLLDWCYTPVFQSGSDYDLKPSAMSNEKKLVAGVVLASVGLRYSSYCSNVGRTILIDPSTNQQNYYKKLLALQEYLVSTVIKDGVSMKAVYEAAQAWLGENEPNLVQHLPKTLGFGTGIEYRDSLLVISAKNETVIKKDMTINLILGFQNLNENGKEYALLLADTLVVGDSSSSLISNASKDLSTNSYFFKASEDAEASPAGKSKKPVDPTAGLKKSKILNTRLRGESKTEEENGEQKRREHQRDLLETLIKEGTQRFSNKEDADANKEAEAKKIFRKYESYRGVAQYPSGISKNHIYVDRRQETIFLPLFGMSVPFHFNTLKNFSKSEEGEYTYLRFNFNTPGQTGTKKDEVLPYDDPNANFVRSFTFRSTDRLRYNDIYKQITDLKRDLQKKEQERRQKADLVEQDRLVEARRNLGVLSDVGIRPHLEGKRLPGDLHIHENGLRFVPVRGDQRLDILFGNIKHLIFQPCDHELYVILHCHLKNPIMVGKKKTKDVQFFKDASDMNYDETNNARRKRRTYGDEDELQAEQEERKRRSRLNKEFKAFAEKISEVSDIITDMPSRDLGFYGAVASSNVMFQPTESCLVQLSETPFTVIELGDVEIANLERVQFGSKYFDLVFVFKDFSKTPVHINSIAMKQLEHLKEWLDFANIFYLESPVALSWPAILKNIQSDPLGFYEDGAWQTLIGEEQDEAASSEEESASEYEVSGAESESEEDDESDYDEEDEESEEEESEFSDEDDSEEEEERPRKSDKKSSGKRSASQEDVRPKKKMK